MELWRAQIEVLRGGLREADREDALAKMSESWDPEIEWDASGAGLPDIDGIYRGKGAVRGFWREWLAAWETIEFDYELLDAGDRVVMLLDQRMRGRYTGIEMPIGKYAQVARFRNGLMVHWKLYMSQAEALKAAGLSE